MKWLSFYIHIPFCRQKCGYCDFLSFPETQENQAAYIKALLWEIEKNRARYANYAVKTIFVGGGTPSVISPKLLGEVMDCIFSQYTVDRDAEITIEANPGTIDKEKLTEYKAMGFNRISMGVQAWQDRLLRTLGRIHDQKTFLENYDLVRKAGFQNINLDFMFSLPEQTLKDWQETLENAVKLDPTHLSCYGLILEEGTPFARLAQQGALTFPDEETDRAMYRLTNDILCQGGYERYEISNFAKKGMECRHNLVYWKDEEYIGFGLGAHSYFLSERFCNTSDFSKYIQGKGNYDQIQEEREWIGKDLEMAEFMFMGLRLTKGVEKERFFRRFHRTMEEVYGPVLEKLQEQGLLRNVHHRVFLTERGLDISNYVFEKFLPE